MLFKIEKETLFKLFKRAALIILEKKSVSSIAGTHVLLKISKEQISITATDLEVEIIVEHPLTTTETTGAAVVPFRKIIDICKAMAVNIELNVAASASDKYKLQIKTDQSFLSVNCLEPESFPVLGQQMFHSEFSIQIKLLKELINKTSFAMGDDDSRRFLNGLSLEFGGGLVRAVAADGHRLMVWEATDSQCKEGIVDLQEEIKPLIPRKSVFDILKIIGDASEQLFAKICIGEQHIRIILDNITYTSKLLLGGFPPFKNLVPKTTKGTLAVEREPFKNCCQRAIALLGGKNQAVKLNFSANSLEISGYNASEDLIQESIPAVLQQGEEAELTFNVSYLADFLSHINTPEVLFKAGESNEGSLMQDSEQQSYYVIMPMQV